MYEEYEKIVINEIDKTLENVNKEDVETLIQWICSAEKVFFVGVGRVLLSLEAIAKRLNHLGIETVVVGEITEPAITDKDILIVGSGSGETGFPLFIASKAKSFGAKVIHIGTNRESSMAKYTDHFVYIPASNKYDSSLNASKQPMTSLFEQSLLILGDIVALMIVNQDKIDISSLWQYHANLE
ncbi:6-phospho-3-hexuloisomerase [Tetragenococcus solitarius]|uniref:6-phospho-3-hexuloisomerase n=1 Tax=Tetragenococcus solitarius TaxID=71453 RepID=A0ABN3Y536_9ENTE|nr:6-phospho-3-hexuloisomerase [Tetragenococcus solitarius]